MDIHLQADSVSTAEHVYQRLVGQYGAQKVVFLKQYLEEVYRLAPMAGLSSDWIVTQASHETGYFTSHAWVRYGNPAGIGITDGTDFQFMFGTGELAARVQIVHFAGYVYGQTVPGVLARFVQLDPRWDALMTSGRAGTVRTVDDLGNGNWATDPAYPAGLKKHYGALIGTPVVPALEDAEENTVATHKFMLSCGHRNTDRGGAVGEYAWTPSSTRALRDAIVARGGKAVILQEVAGTDWFFNGGLQAGARKCVELAAKHGPFDAYISSHYNGVPAGFHAIFPDGTGDTEADNPLDLKLCRAMAKHVKAKGTVPLLGWTKDSPGVMSEKETRVGEQGFRLGEMAGTLGFRDTTARVILEAGGIGSADRQYITNPAWVRDVYAEAIVDSLEEVFGTFRTASETVPEPAVPHDPRPVTVYAKTVKRDWVERLRTGASIYENVGGAEWYAVNRLYQSINEDERRQYGTDGSPLVGENVPAGTVAGMTAIGKSADGNVRLISDWDTVFDGKDWELVDWPEITSEAA